LALRPQLVSANNHTAHPRRPVNQHTLRVLIRVKD